MAPDGLLSPVLACDDEEATLQRALAYFNRARFRPSFIGDRWKEDLKDESRLRLLEGEFVEGCRRRIECELIGLPTNVREFVGWYEELLHSGPGQGDTLFPWLAAEATIEEMRWFLHQEVAGEAGFEDLLAMTQLKLPVRPKLEMARNYWDELGRGQANGMHGPMLGRLAEALGLHPTPETTVGEALTLGNLMTGLAANRRYAYQSIGALGIIELTAPGRAACVATGLRRLGLTAKQRLYFELHACLDIKHSAAWNREVIYPIAAADPATIRALAEGALLRLHAGRRCFERYRREFGLA